MDEISCWRWVEANNACVLFRGAGDATDVRPGGTRSCLLALPIGRAWIRVEAEGRGGNSLIAAVVEMIDHLRLFRAVGAPHLTTTFYLGPLDRLGDVDVLRPEEIPPRAFMFDAVPQRI